jgi:hypothetical protein
MPISLSGIKDFLALLLSAEELSNQAYNLLVDASSADHAIENFLMELSLALTLAPNLGDADEASAFLVNFCAAFHENQPHEQFCQGFSQKSPEGGKSRLLRLHDMQHYEFGPFRGRGWAAKELDDVRQKLIHNPEELSDTLTGRLRGSCQHFFWVTNTDCLEKLLDHEPGDSRPFGQVIRDTMGFMADIGDIEYVELQFVGDFFDSFMRPTVVEGGLNLVYCSWPYDSYNTGFTWDIFRSTVGVPEFVSPARDLKTGEARLKYLARIAFDTPPYIDWSALSLRLAAHTEHLVTTLGIGK